MKKYASAPTMKDVAREAGVSLGTVSKVMNGIPVGDSYRKRVEEAADRLGYQVNSYARGLKTNKTHTIALIWPTITHPFFGSLADAVIAQLMRRDYKALVMLNNYDPEIEKKSISLVRQNKVDGIIALTYSPDLQVDPQIPFVTIDRHVGSQVPCISADNFGGGQIAAEKLIASGCSRLLFMRIGSAVAGEADKRGAGFESVCRQRGVPYESLILNDADTNEPFYRYLEAHVQNGKADFDGIFCNTDRLAIQILHHLQKLHVRVPEDVQLIGFDGIPDYATGRPYCSTIVQPIDQMAEAAVSLLLNGDGSALPSLLALPVHFYAGGTTRI